MKILTISGSMRRASSNSQLLHSLKNVTPFGVTLEACSTIGDLPIFNPDNEGERTPVVVEYFCQEIRQASGIIISSPEYVHAIPGGLKNAIDWLVSREEIIRKPVVLAHASHRGSEALQSLQRVLSTVSAKYTNDIFLSIPIASLSPEEIDSFLSQSENVNLRRNFIEKYVEYIDTISDEEYQC